MDILNFFQIGVAVLLIACILVQNRGGGLSGIFGGGEGNAYRTRRGFEKNIFIATIVLAVAFFGISFLSIII